MNRKLVISVLSITAIVLILASISLKKQFEALSNLYWAGLVAFAIALILQFTGKKDA